MTSFTPPSRGRRSAVVIDYADFTAMDEETAAKLLDDTDTPFEEYGASVRKPPRRQRRKGSDRIYLWGAWICLILGAASCALTLVFLAKSVGSNPQYNHLHDHGLLVEAVVTGGGSQSQVREDGSTYALETATVTFMFNDRQTNATLTASHPQGPGHPTPATTYPVGQQLRLYVDKGDPSNFVVSDPYAIPRINAISLSPLYAGGLFALAGIACVVRIVNRRDSK